MKFEEIFPKMRDEGTVGCCGRNYFKFINGEFLWMPTPFTPWEPLSHIPVDFLTGDWAYLLMEVKKWIWVFGCEDEYMKVSHSRMTEAEAEEYRVLNDYDWMERIEHTMTQEEK